VKTSARAPLVAMTACGVAFVAVRAIAYGVGPIGRLDARALHALMQLDHSWIRSSCWIIASSANTLPFVAIVVALLAAGVATARYRQTIAAATFIAVAMGTAEVLKVVLAEPRFHAVLGTHQIGAAAYPSGHTTAATALALATVLVATPRWRPLVAIGASAYAIWACLSILILGFHYSSDVVGGVLLAGFWFCAAVAALELAGATGARTGPGFTAARGLSLRMLRRE
jgi:membrane-associated phospholipid phosphatase